ncbi:MAG: hypothetical protein EA409_07260 [Saprospirales bacterium]|nr:MAG: hypothetical protein EA409_07260 [Saprospirales bacterium]
MKLKFLLALIAFSLAIVPLEAQFNIKPYVGANSTTLSRDFQDEEFKSNLGYQFGIDLMIGRRIYIQPGLNYEFARVGVSNPEISDLKISRINLPVFAGVKMFQEDVDKYFDIRIFTGPSISFMADFSGGSGLGISSSEVKSFNVAWNAGLGVDLFMFFLDVAYKWDVDDFFKRSVESSASQNVFYANLGLRFTF